MLVCNQQRGGQSDGCHVYKKRQDNRDLNRLQQPPPGVQVSTRYVDSTKVALPLKQGFIGFIELLAPGG